MAVLSVGHRASVLFIHFTTFKTNLSALSGLHGPEHVSVLGELVLLPPRAVPVHVMGAGDLSALPPEEIHPGSALCSEKQDGALGPTRLGWYRLNIWGNSA